MLLGVVVPQLQRSTGIHTGRKLLCRRASVLYTLSLLLLPFRSRSYSSYDMTSITERSGDGTIVVSPRNEQDQSALVVWCHGLGDTAEGFVDVAEHLATKMPYCKFILPTAPTQPVTMNMGMRMPSWYDIVGLDERANENCKGIDASQAQLEKILQDEHESTGLPYQRMVLAGFSQGGALSLYTGLQLPQALAGIVLTSGYLPHISEFDLKQPTVPVWHGHGTQDAIVAPKLAEKSRDAVMAKGCTSYTLKMYEVGHTVSMDEIGDVMAFLQSILPDDETCRVKLQEPSEMSVKELKAAIRKAGLQRQAVGFMEKSEFIKLLQDYRAGKL